MRVLVTGCGGFLGSEIVRQLRGRGDEVIGISRREYPELVQLGMQHKKGDLVDLEFCLSAIHRCDAVVHTAAVASVWGPWKHFYEINTVATENVIKACQAAKIRTLVFTSSPSVTFNGSDQSGISETEYYPSRWLCHYPHTKALAEQAVLKANQEDILHTVSLRPHLIWSEDDPHIIPRLIERAKSGRLRIVGDGKNVVDTVHVVNAAAAHLDALDTLSSHPRDAAGRAYFITQDDPVNCWHWISQLCELHHVEPPQKKISFRLAWRIGAMLETLYRTTGRRSEPPMTRFVAAQLAKDHFFDISSAKQRLGYRIRLTTDEGLQRIRDKQPF